MDQTNKIAFALIALMLTAGFASAAAIAPIVVRTETPGDQSYDLVVNVPASGAPVVSAGTDSGAKYEIVASQRVLENIVFSSDPSGALTAAIRNGDVSLDSADPSKKVELELLKALLPDKSVEKKPGDNVDFEGCSVPVQTTSKGIPAIQVPGSTDIVVLNKYSRASGYTSNAVQNLGGYQPNTVSLTGGVYNVPTSIRSVGPSLAPVANLQYAFPPAGQRNFFLDLFNYGKANGGFLHGTNLYVGPPPGAAPPTTAAIYMAPGAYYGAPPGAYTGLYPVQTPLGTYQPYHAASTGRTPQPQSTQPTQPVQSACRSPPVGCLPGASWVSSYRNKCFIQGTPTSADACLATWSCQQYGGTVCFRN